MGAPLSDRARRGIRELIVYGLVGVTTTLVNLGAYYGLLALGVDYALANLVAIVSAKVYAYFGNKFFVFRSRCATWGELVGELVRYVLARGFTGLVDFFGLIVAVEYLGADERFSKLVLQVVVIVLNFVLGKFAVFVQEGRGSSDGK